VEPLLTTALSGFTELLSAIVADEEEDPLHPTIKQITNRDKKMEANRFICYFLMKKYSFFSLEGRHFKGKKLP
jgi:hypothetical protein